MNLKYNKEERKEILEKVYKLSFEYEKIKGGCAQSVIAAIQDTFELVDDNIFKSGQCFCAGGALSGYDSCGALNGGIMILSYCFGRTRKMFNAGKVQKNHYS